MQAYSEKITRMKTIKWGFIGCGEVTEKKSGPAFAEIEGSEVVAVMSRTEQRARAYAEHHQIRRWYTDAQSLIDDPEVNAVYIATPPSSHVTFAIMAMHAGKPVYVEKPLAASYEDCQRVNYVSQKTGVPCFVAYYRRELPYFNKVKSIVRSGQLGKISTVQIRYAAKARPEDYDRTNLPWRLHKEIAGGGYFYDMAPTQFDLLQDIFGVIIKADGICANRGGLYDAEDSVAASFMFENGIPGSGTWSFVSHESAQVDRIEIVGDKGLIHFSVFDHDPIHLITENMDTYLEVPNPEYVQKPLIEKVVRDLQGIEKCMITNIEATPTNWVLDRILGKY